MKLCLQKVLAAPFLSTLLLSLGASQVIVMPLLADEFTNITDIKGCRVIKGEAERLRCYDTVTDGGIFNEEQLKQVQVEEFGSRTVKEAPEPAPTPAPVPAAATTQAPAPATGRDMSTDRLYVTIVHSKKDMFGFYHFQTSDGQVWKQQNAGSWSASVPFEAKIKAGAFGSFFLVNEGGKSTRVKRVR